MEENVNLITTIISRVSPRQSRFTFNIARRVVPHHQATETYIAGGCRFSLYTAEFLWPAWFHAIPANRTWEWAIWHRPRDGQLPVANNVAKKKEPKNTTPNSQQPWS